MNSLLREIRKKINNRKRNKTTQDRERGVSFDELFDKMEKVIVQKQLFLDCGYRITDLAREVGTNRTYITRILKERGLNYVTYLNSFRIQYAMLLMSDPENRKGAPGRHCRKERFCKRQGHEPLPRQAHRRHRCRISQAGARQMQKKLKFNLGRLDHILRIENLVKLSLGEELLVKDELVNAAACYKRFLSHLGASSIADVRLECRYDADAMLSKLLAVLLVGGDTVDALDAESVESVGHPGHRLYEGFYEYWLHNVELELCCLGSHCDAGVVADDLEANLVGNLRNDRVDLARHD